MKVCYSFRVSICSMLALYTGLLLLLPFACLGWDPAEGEVPWQPEEIALFELVTTLHILRVPRMPLF